MSEPAASPSEGRAALLAAARAELAERGHAGVSLRAVARRAGMSHAAPKYFFGDRAGLLTAVAAQGFAELARSLRQVPPALAALGHAYITFALANPALFDLMFRPSELHPADPDLRHAEDDAIGVLESAVTASGAPGEQPPTAPGEFTLISWALAHGLAVLSRDGALQPASHGGQRDSADLACHLVDVFIELLTRQHAQP
jgi:AcrR family transcriptional regulator